VLSLAAKGSVKWMAALVYMERGRRMLVMRENEVEKR
jgi:hypothetical protein